MLSRYFLHRRRAELGRQLTLAIHLCTNSSSIRASQGSFTFDAASSSLAFSYSTLEISLFRLGPFVFDREPKPNVYEFYHCGDGILCAHSRGAGAETLLRKLPST